MKFIDEEQSSRNSSTNYTCTLQFLTKSACVGDGELTVVSWFRAGCPAAVCRPSGGLPRCRVLAAPLFERAGWWSADCLAGVSGYTKTVLFYLRPDFRFPKQKVRRRIENIVHVESFESTALVIVEPAKNWRENARRITNEKRRNNRAKTVIIRLQRRHSNYEELL